MLWKAGQRAGVQWNCCCGSAVCLLSIWKSCTACVLHMSYPSYARSIINTIHSLQGVVTEFIVHSAQSQNHYSLGRVCLGCQPAEAVP
jgi:hypothetical protein